MKRLLVLPLVGVLLLVFAFPCLADDSTGVNVDIGISTPGDVAVDVAIDAGGDVDITVDGVDFKQTALTALTALEATGADGTGSINTADWYRYWNKEIAAYNNYLASVGTALSILARGEAKLIQEREVSEIAIDMLRVQGDKTWNQLMYGAESHIVVLDARVTAQSVEIASLREQLSQANSNSSELRGYVDSLLATATNTFWIMTSVVFALAVAILGLCARIRQLR